MPIPAETLERVKRATVAVGCLLVPWEEFKKDPDAPVFRIFGTGFLIRHDVVLTNRHVLAQLTAFVENRGLPSDRSRVQFTYTAGTDLRQAFQPIQRRGTVDDSMLDLAFISFEMPRDADFRQCQPLLCNSHITADVGEEVFVYGYPFGSLSLEREIDGRRQAYRFGPVLQQGFVSAFAPFDESDHIHRILLDLRTAGGMSGSPVVDPHSGRVIGIHDAGMEATIAFAIPLSTELLDTLLRLHDTAPLDRPIAATIEKHVRRGPLEGAA